MVLLSYNSNVHKAVLTTFSSLLTFQMLLSEAEIVCLRSNCKSPLDYRSSKRKKAHFILKCCLL